MTKEKVEILAVRRYKYGVLILTRRGDVVREVAIDTRHKIAGEAADMTRALRKARDEYLARFFDLSAEERACQMVWEARQKEKRHIAHAKELMAHSIDSEFLYDMNMAQSAAASAERASNAAAELVFNFKAMFGFDFEKSLEEYQPIDIKS